MPGWVKTGLWIVGGYLVLMYLAVPELCDRFNLLCRLDKPGVSRDANQRTLHGNTLPADRQPSSGRAQPQRGSMPTIDCAAAGGRRTTNPATGKPSCFVPD